MNNNNVESKERAINTNDVPEFIGQIIDIFDDFLEKNNVTIPRTIDELMGAGDDFTNGARLFGSDYDELEKELKKTLVNWELIDDTEIQASKKKSMAEQIEENKSRYVYCYQRTIDRCLSLARDKNVKPELFDETVSDFFEEIATAEDVVGYYINEYEDYALEQWNKSKDDSNEEINNNVLHKAVDAILNILYPEM